MLVNLRLSVRLSSSILHSMIIKQKVSTGADKLPALKLIGTGKTFKLKQSPKYFRILNGYKMS